MNQIHGAKMSAPCFVSMFTITILAALCCAGNLSPVVSVPSSELAAHRQPASALVAPAGSAGADNRNQGPGRSSSREDTQLKPKYASGLAPSQMSGFQQAAAQDSFNPVAPMIPPSWNHAQPAPTGGGHQRDLIYGQNFNDKLAADHPDRLVEGSGAGPQPGEAKNQKVKLDDTEDSDDDDDEDYDDKEPNEPNSGHVANHVAVTTQRPAPPSGSLADTIRKPAYNDFYNPFRPAANAAAQPAGANSNYAAFNQTRPTTTSPPTLAPHAAHAVPTLPMPTSRRPASNYTSAINTPINGGQVPPSSNRNKTETDYDYEDENVDDELEETSVFEDNDPSDTADASSNKSPGQPVGRLNATKPEPPKVVGHRPPVSSDVSQGNLSNSQPPKPDVPRPNGQVPPIRPPPSAPTISRDSAVVTSRPHVAKETTPNNLGAVEGGEGDEEDEEEVEEEEEDEEEEEEDSDMGDGNSDEDGLPEFKVPLAGRPGANASSPMQNQNAQYRPAAGKPPAVQPINTFEQAIPPAVAPSSQANQPINQYFSPPARPAPPTPTALPPVLGVQTTTPTAMRPTAPPPTARNPPIQQFGGFMEPTRPAAILETTEAVTTSQPPPLAVETLPTMRAPAPTAPAYYPTTLRPYLVSTPSPTRRVAPPVVATTTNIQPFDKDGIGGYTTSDDSLTRQIYDRAVEAYHEANKTMRAAVDAVWPPNFDFDYSTLEPLLAQPIFFMLALGGAIICLVLLMMLIVYMISYQTKPRRYEHDDISIY